MFFKASEQRQSLPANCPTHIVDSFLACLISLISLNTEEEPITMRSVRVLFSYLKNGKQEGMIILDPQVYQRFKPNKLIIRKMNIEGLIRCNLLLLPLAHIDEDADLALDFASFLLRYHRDLDYSDFSDDLGLQTKIRRAEAFRSWADIEDLANGYESL